MIKLGITGGIGCGKSYVAHLLQERGIPVYDTDREAKRLMVSHPVIRRKLTELLGEAVYEGDVLNKPLLAGYLFACKDNAERVNSVVHPCVYDDFLRWTKMHECSGKETVAMESAILFESGFDRLVDKVLLVRAPGDVCLKRAMRRDCASEEAVKARMAAQMSDEERCAKADYIIDNDGNSDVERRLEEVLRRVVAETRVEIKLF